MTKADWLARLALSCMIGEQMGCMISHPNTGLGYSWPTWQSPASIRCFSWLWNKSLAANHKHSLTGIVDLNKEQNSQRRLSSTHVIHFVDNEVLVALLVVTDVCSGGGHGLARPRFLGLRSRLGHGGATCATHGEHALVRWGGEGGSSWGPVPQLQQALLCNSLVLTSVTVNGSCSLNSRE